MTGSRPAPRKSGRAPRWDALDTLEPLEPITLEALEAAVFIQNQRKMPNVGPKSRFLSELATDLELALIEKKPKDLTDRLCLGIAAMALRILEQGDGH